MATQTRIPVSEVAVTGTWSGTSRHLLLDDYPDSSNPIADGSTCSANGVIQFGFSAFNIPAGSTGISVQVRYYDFKNGSQASAIAGSIRCNDTTNRNAATHNPANGNGAIAARSDNWATNPKSAAAWTVDDINGISANKLTSFGLAVTDASPTVTVSCVQLQVTYTPPQNAGQIYSAYIELPDAPRYGLVHNSYIEYPSAPRSGFVFNSYVELPDAALPNRFGIIYNSYAGYPAGPRTAKVYNSYAEYPTAPRQGRVFNANIELPNAPVFGRHGIVYGSYIQFPNAPRYGKVYSAYISAPIFNRQGIIYNSRVEIPPLNKRVIRQWDGAEWVKVQ